MTNALTFSLDRDAFSAATKRLKAELGNTGRGLNHQKLMDSLARALGFPDAHRIFTSLKAAGATTSPTTKTRAAPIGRMVIDLEGGVIQRIYTDTGAALAGLEIAVTDRDVEGADRSEYQSVIGDPEGNYDAFVRGIDITSVAKETVEATFAALRTRVERATALDAATERLTTLLLAHEAPEDVLDELVLDLCSAEGSRNANMADDEEGQERAISTAELEGSRVNNRGTPGQIRFLIEALGLEEAQEQILDAAGIEDLNVELQPTLVPAPRPDRQPTADALTKTVASKSPRLTATVTIQEKEWRTGDLIHVDTVDIDVTSLLNDPAADLRGALEAFDYDGAPYLENLSGPASDALAAVHGGPTEVDLSIGDFLRARFEEMGICTEDDEMDGHEIAQLLSDELLAKVRQHIHFVDPTPRPGDTEIFEIGDRHYLAVYQTTGWRDGGNFASAAAAAFAARTVRR